MSENKKDKLHALLAVEGDVKAQADAIIAETAHVFKEKQSHFKSKHRVYLPMVDGGHQFPEEKQEMVTTVDQKIAHTQKYIIKSIDAAFQKEATNTVAKADLVLDGEIIAENVPASALLNFENKIKVIRNLYKKIPTLPPGKLWIKDEGDTKGVYRAEQEISYRNEKQLQHKVLYEATKEHPAQIEKFAVDVPVGKWTTVERSGMWTPNKKAEVLDRVDNLLAAVKKARQRANSVEVLKEHIGKKFFDYIHAT